jgi:hypothetical protein
MQPAEKKKKENPSMLSEILWGFLGLLLGDASSRIGFALLLLVGGILFLTLPVADLDGKNSKMDTSLCVMGIIFLLFSVILLISWIRKRKKSKTSK